MSKISFIMAKPLYLALLKFGVFDAHCLKLEKVEKVSIGKLQEEKVSIGKLQEEMNKLQEEANFLLYGLGNPGCAKSPLGYEDLELFCLNEEDVLTNYKKKEIDWRVASRWKSGWQLPKDYGLAPLLEGSPDACRANLFGFGEAPGHFGYGTFGRAFGLITHESFIEETPYNYHKYVPDMRATVFIASRFNRKDMEGKAVGESADLVEDVKNSLNACIGNLSFTCVELFSMMCIHRSDMKDEARLKPDGRKIYWFGKNAVDALLRHAGEKFQWQLKKEEENGSGERGLKCIGGAADFQSFLGVSEYRFPSQGFEKLDQQCVQFGKTLYVAPEYMSFTRTQKQDFTREQLRDMEKSSDTIESVRERIVRFVPGITHFERDYTNSINEMKTKRGMERKMKEKMKEETKEKMQHNNK